MHNTDILQNILKNVEMGTCKTKFDQKKKHEIQMHVIWDCQKYRFQDSAVIALTVLTVPYTKAAEERVC